MRNPLLEHIRELAQSAPERSVLIECDEEGKVVKEITRADLLEKIEGKIAAHAQHSSPLLIDAQASSEFLVTVWAAWCDNIPIVPLDAKRDTEELRAYKKQAASHATNEALILFTSGTTARPKGARLSLENLFVNARDIASWLHMNEHDRFLVQLPLHHINSTTFCLSALLSGGSIILPPRYSSSNFWNIAARTGATITSLVQTIIFDQLARKKEFEDVRDSLALSRIQIGSAPVDPAAAAEFVRLFAIPLFQGYGQTETALRVTGVPMDLSPELYASLLAENSIGTPLPWAEVEIMNSEGAILSEGEEGELVVKGKAVMAGYVMGEEAFRNGWFLTGDVGYWKLIEGMRFFYLKGRSKELIIKGGVNISPIAVEEAVKRISSDIEQAYAIGVPDARYGEEVGVVVVWREGVNEKTALRKLKILLLIGSTHIRAYETPFYLASVKSSDLPVTSTGKVQRVLLKERAKLSSLHSLWSTQENEFVVLDAQSPEFQDSLSLYNHCWQPLTKTPREYKEFLQNTVTIGAFKHNALKGQISFKKENDTLTCVSICSASYKPKKNPEVSRTPSPEEVEQYVHNGKDPVINFHTAMGARVHQIIQDGRPQDMSSCGYTIMLEYPQFKRDSLTEDAPVSVQLIELVRLIGADAGLSVAALSRPGGLASFMASSVL